jgi:hypothetical protein
MDNINIKEKNLCQMMLRVYFICLFRIKKVYYFKSPSVSCLNKVSEEDDDYNKIEEIREDNIQAANKQQSKSRRRMLASDTYSDK